MFSNLLKTKQSFPKQRAQIKWLQETDKNMRFFHAMIQYKQWKKSIFTLKKLDDNDITSQELITEEFLFFYTNLLGTKHPTKELHPQVLQMGS